MFQLDKLSVKQKSDIGYGKQLAQYIDSTVRGGISSYFWVRNARWRTNRGYANGRIPMSKFQDLLEFNGKVNYLNINWQSINIVNRVVSGLVGRWMGRSEKIKVSATDSISSKQKQGNSRLASGMKFFREQEVMRIDSNGGLGIGGGSPSTTLGAWGEWQEIQKLAESNPAVKIALDKLMTVYHLSKEHGNDET